MRQCSSNGFNNREKTRCTVCMTEKEKDRVKEYFSVLDGFKLLSKGWFRNRCKQLSDSFKCVAFIERVPPNILCVMSINIIGCYIPHWLLSMDCSQKGEQCWTEGCTYYMCQLDWKKVKAHIGSYVIHMQWIWWGWTELISYCFWTTTWLGLHWLHVLLSLERWGSPLKTAAGFCFRLCLPLLINIQINAG